MLKKFVGMSAALSLAAAPAVAQTSASKLSVVSSARADAQVDGEKLAGVSTGILIAVGVAVAAVLAFVVFDDDDSDSP